MFSSQINAENYKNIGIVYRYITNNISCRLFIRINGNNEPHYFRNLREDITAYTEENTGIIPGLDGQTQIQIIFETPTTQGDCRIDRISVYGTDIIQNDTDFPTEIPTNNPSRHPTNTPIVMPSVSNEVPTDSPTMYPTNISNSYPSNMPSYSPNYSTTNPTYAPNIYPSYVPTNIPSQLTNNPTIYPSIILTTHSSINTTLQVKMEPTVTVFVIRMPSIFLIITIIGFVIFICGSILTAIHVYIKCFRSHKHRASLAEAMDDNNKTIPSESVPNINNSYPVKLQYVNTSTNKHKIPSQPKINNDTNNGEQNEKKHNDSDIENSEINSMNEGITTFDIDVPKLTTDGNNENDV